jgi:hypothetical protein
VAGEDLEVGFGMEQRSVGPDRRYRDEAVRELPDRLAGATTSAIEVGSSLVAPQPVEGKEWTSQGPGSQVSLLALGAYANEQLEADDFGDRQGRRLRGRDA